MVSSIRQSHVNYSLPLASVNTKGTDFRLVIVFVQSVSRCYFLHNETRWRVTDTEYWLIDPDHNALSIETVTSQDRANVLANVGPSTSVPL